jgi:hypothetical protein
MNLLMKKTDNTKAVNMKRITSTAWIMSGIPPPKKLPIAIGPSGPGMF